MKQFIIDRLKSFPPAFNGIKFVIIHEKNSWIHLIFTILVLGVSSFFKISLFEWLFVISAIFSVWICEMINTSIEKIVDLIIKDKNSTAKIIKDIAAGFVFLSAIYSIVVGIVVFMPKLIK